VSTTAGEAPWRVGIEDPTDPSRVLQVVSVARALSQHRARRIEVRIIDPIRHEPATAALAITVVGPQPLWCDVYATAAAVRGPAAVTWLTGVPGYEAVVVHLGGHLDATPGWPGT
jgi:thiamine biosynthesis lipoprotein